METYEKGKISVIMGIYNCQDTLIDSIESMINQTYDNWELIMCDDYSKDNTYKIAQLYANKYADRIILIKNKENKKLAATLNHCLEYVKGEFIARMDGDDISLPDRFEKQVNFLNKNKEYDLVGCAMIPFDENGDRGVRYTEEIPNKTTIFKISPFAHATIMARKYVYDKLNGYTVSSRTMRGQDIDLWIRFFNREFKGYNLQVPLYKVRESKNDLKRRTIKAGWGTTKTLIYGAKLNKLPFRYYIFSFKPLVSSIIPSRIMYLYHNTMMKKLGE